MERRVGKLVRAHEQAFKNAIKDWFLEHDPEYSHVTDLLRHVYDYPNLALTADDFQRRKRVKNSVPLGDRCTAKRANGERCTRRRRDGCELCGTHAKGTPHGVVDKAGDGPTTVAVELWLREVKGINYHVDSKGNVYSAEDVVSGASRPRVIGHLTEEGDLTFT